VLVHVWLKVGYYQLNGHSDPICSMSRVTPATTLAVPSHRSDDSLLQVNPT